MRAYIDPATGELRDPTPAELAAEAAAKSGKDSRRTALALGTHVEEVETPLPGGGYSLRPAHPVRHEVTACLRADGSVQFDCPKPEAR